MSSGQRILIIEDDESLRLALCDNLEAEGYDVISVATGGEAMARVRETPLDLIILDLMLPDTDGYRLCEEVRQMQLECRILMLTARSLDEDVVRGFDAGADDYVAKPYRLALLLARVRALLRRGAVGSAPTQRSTFSFGAFSLDEDSRIVKNGAGELVDLTRKEFDILRYFLRNAGRALGRQQILEAVWGTDVVVDERTVDNFVSSMKKKLGWSPNAGFRIATVRGVGYRMELDGSS